MKETGSSGETSNDADRGGKPRIWLILPNDDLKKLAKKVVCKNAKLVQGYQIEIVCADATDALKKAKKAKKMGAQAIVSRGGTATLIEERFPDIPVVRIRPSAVLIAFRYGELVEKHGKENVFLIASDDFFPDRTAREDMERMAGPENIKIHEEFPVKGQPRALRGLSVELEERFGKNNQMFVFGSTSATRIAEELEIPCETIKSTEQDMLDAIKTAIRPPKSAFVGLALENLEVERCFDKAIKPVLTKYGFHVISHLGRRKPELIMEAVVRQIELAELVIVDITGNRPNCYFELGFAKGQKKNVVISAKRKTKPHFDIEGERRISWNGWEDLENKLGKTLDELDYSPVA